MERVFGESQLARKIKIIGFVGWTVTIALAVVLSRPDFLGAVGAVGLAALGSYAYLERQEIARNRNGMRRMFGSGYHEIMRMTRSEYDRLPPEEKQQFDETGADIGSTEMMFEDEFEIVERRELKLAIVLTLQWAFGAAIYDACVWLFGRMEVAG